MSKIGHLRTSQKLVSIAVSVALFIGIPVAIGIVYSKYHSDVSTSPIDSSQVTYTEGTGTAEGQPADMSGYTFLNQNKSHGFVNISFATANSMLSSKGTGIIYVGFTGCEWCQRAVPVLDKLADNNNLAIQYLNLDNQSTSDEGYDKFKILYHSCLSKGDDGTYHLYTPLVIAVKNGEIVGYHSGVVPNFEITDETSNLNEDQFNELLDIYQQLYEKIK